MRRRLGIMIGGVLVGAALFTGCSTEGDSPSATATVTETVTPGGPPPADASIGDGTWMVGTDIQPGTYRTDGGERCEWERLSGTSGEYDDIIAMKSPEGPAVVTIAPSDVAFTTEGCADWTPLD